MEKPHNLMNRPGLAYAETTPANDQRANDLAFALYTQRSVQIGDERRYQNQSAFPFWQNFTAYPYQFGEINPGTGLYGLTATSAEGPDGLLIAPGQILQIPINLGRDMAFQLLNIKFGAHIVSTESTVPNAKGSREILVGPQNSLQFGNSMFDATMNQRIPYWQMLDVSVYFQSSGARDLYGGLTHRQFNSQLETAALQVPQNDRIEVPIPSNDLQGNADGMGVIRMPYQLPAAALINIKVTSRAPTTVGNLMVYGALFGYKVKI